MAGDLAEGSVTNLNSRTPEEQLLDINNFAPFVKRCLSELLQVIVPRTKPATDIGTFKEQCTNLKTHINDWKMSSARAGACNALTLAKSYYPIVDFESIAKGRPKKKPDGTAFSSEEYKEISKVARPFATRIANFADVSIFHRAYATDGKPIGMTSGGTIERSTPSSSKLTTAATGKASSSSVGAQADPVREADPHAVVSLKPHDV